MPRFRVLCKLGKKKKREWYNTYTAKDAKAAIAKAKAEDKKIHKGSKKPGLRGKYALPKSHSWKAVKV